MAARCAAFARGAFNLVYLSFACSSGIDDLALARGGARHALPVPCDAKWALPDSRWPEHRPKDARRSEAVPNGPIQAWALLKSRT
jgi:hypothetical protein